MDDLNRQTLLKNRKYLIDNLVLDAYHFAHFLETGILTQRQVDQINSKSITDEKIACFLEILPRRGPDAFTELCAAYKDDCPWIVKKLNETKQMLTENQGTVASPTKSQPQQEASGTEETNLEQMVSKVKIDQKDPVLKKKEDKVADLRKMCRGQDRVKLAKELTLLGVYHINNTNNDTKARECKEEAVSIYREVFGEDEADEDFAWAVGTLGVSYSRLGMKDEEKKANEESVSMFRKVCGPQSDNTLFAHALVNLGNYYSGQGEDDKAMKVKKEGLAIYRRKFGDHGVDDYLAWALACLGDTYLAVDQPQNAVKCHEEAYEMYMKTKPNHPNVLLCIRQLIKGYEKLGQNDKVRKYTQLLNS